MRIHPLCLLLVVAVPTLVAAATNCIIGCKCDENDARKLKIQECDSPLIVTKDALNGVSKKLTNIKIRNVVIKRIDEDAFSGFNELETVIIEDASIESIHPKAFYLPELGIITFTRTTFGETPHINSEYLEELIFNDCKLSEVPNLDHLPALSFLNLDNNLIKEVPESTFNNVDSLEEVTLANNSITALPSNLFNNNPDFNVLNLDNNPLTSFFFNFSTPLEFLSLKNCNLTTFDRRITENINLVSSLDLSGNRLSVLDIDVFEPMKDLNNLVLSNNLLVELDDEIFYENSKLDTIVLDNNPFETLPKFKTKGSVFQTYTFSCKNCGLTSITGSFDQMKALVTIDLSNNKLKNVDGLFTEMTTLKELLLSNNQIATIGINSFGTNSELETLDLSNNPLLPLDPVVFASIPQLKKLNVSGANLKKLWANHNAELPALERLLVDRNQLSVLTDQDVKILPKLKLLDLEENPLICSEDLYDLVSYLKGKQISPKSVSVQTHEEMKTTESIDRPKTTWAMVLPKDCNMNIFDDYDNDLYTDDDDDDETDDDIEIEDDTPYDDTDYEGKDAGVEASVLNTSGFNLAKASYILSITSVFILTALLVLFVAVLVTLLILRRNKAFNMPNGNLPRLKIPLWHTTPGQKKHSGSVYRPLSEEYSGSRTPIINRYEFKQTPQVHNPLP